MRRTRLQLVQGIKGVGGAATEQLTVIHHGFGCVSKSQAHHGQPVLCRREAALLHPRLTGRNDIEPVQR